MGRRARHRRAHRLLHEPPGVPGVLRRPAVAPAAEAAAAHDSTARRRRRRRRRMPRGRPRTRRAPHGSDASHGGRHPHESPWMMTRARWSCWPAAGLVGGAAQPAVRRRSTCSTSGSNPSSAPHRRAAHRRRPRKWSSAWPSTVAGACVGIGRRPRRVVAARPITTRSSRPLLTTGLVHRPAVRRRHREARASACPTSAPVVRQGRRSTARSTASAGWSAAVAASCAKLQTGYVRNYALGHRRRRRRASSPTWFRGVGV